MFNRVISLILIAAVFGCPLWCSMGLCQCSSEITALNAPASDCCCGPIVNADTSGYSTTETPGPEPAPESLRCQGICGGAVFESPYRVPGAEFCQLFSCLDSNAYRSFPKDHCFAWKAGISDIPRAENQGSAGRTCSSRRLSSLP